MRAALAVLLCTLLPASLPAQRLVVGPLLWGMRSSEETNGGGSALNTGISMAIGAEGSLTLGRFALHGSYLGWPEADYECCNGANGQAPGGRTSTAEVAVRVVSGLELGLQAEARRYDDAQSTLLHFAGAIVRLRVGMGEPGLAGTAEFSALGGLPEATFLTRGVVGAVIAPARSRVSVQVAYRFERINIGSTNGSAETVREYFGPIVGLMLRLGR